MEMDTVTDITQDVMDGTDWMVPVRSYHVAHDSVVAKRMEEKGNDLTELRWQLQSVRERLAAAETPLKCETRDARGIEEAQITPGYR